MTKLCDTARSLLHRTGVAGPARSRALRGAGAPSRPRTLAALATLATALGILALTTAPASAVETRSFEASFGPGGTAATAFGQPAAVGVDQSTGDLYVADVSAGTVQKFNSAHEPSIFTGVSPNISGSRLTGFSFHAGLPVSDIAVSSSTHDFYVVNFPGSLRAYQSDGEPANFTVGPGAGTNELGGFEALCGVAVNANGDIYAGDSGRGASQGVHVYAPSGEPLATIAASNACNVAVDSHGIVYLNHFEAAVEKFTPSIFPVTASTTYTSAGIVNANPAWGVTVDPATNALFVDEHTQIAEYDEAGTRVLSFGARGPGALTASEGLAVNGASDVLYVSDAGGNHLVEIFGAAANVPEVVTGAATEVTGSSATPSGAINPEGVNVTDCHFDYGTSTSYGQTAACEQTVGSGTGEVAVTARLTGLMPGTTYHFRLQASNANGTNFGEDATLETLPAPSIASEMVTSVTASSADLQATVNPVGFSVTSCTFQYGTSTAYGNSVPCEQSLEQIGNESLPVPVSAVISGLSANTTYHWRFVTSNAAGTATSTDHTFVYPTTGEGLPDNRAYEMVTPPFKNGSLIGDIFLGPHPDISETGSRVIAMSIQCFAASESCTGLRLTNGEPFEFTRTSAGWVTSALAPSAQLFTSNSPFQVSADAGTALFSMPTGPLGEDEWYARSSEGSLLPFGPATPPEVTGVTGYGLPTHA